MRNVIVNEFAGPEPSAQILDAVVIYLEDIDFLPNPGLDPVGRLKSAAGAARGSMPANTKHSDVWAGPTSP